MKARPTLREEAKLEIASAASNNAIRVLENTHHYPFKTCMYCENFNEEKELCKLYNMRPPAAIIAFGCEKYEDDDEIPF
jgi:5-formaminoimidazole-4-carboxamide-1-beta-D-ribofuranosyl 5'-monophosphate synthetase